MVFNHWSYATIIAPPFLSWIIKQTGLLLGVAKCKESTNERVNSIHRHACIKTRLLLGVAKTKESRTGRKSKTP